MKSASGTPARALAEAFEILLGVGARRENEGPTRRARRKRLLDFAELASLGRIERDAGMLGIGCLRVDELELAEDRVGRVAAVVGEIPAADFCEPPREPGCFDTPSVTSPLSREIGRGTVALGGRDERKRELGLGSTTASSAPANSAAWA